MNNYEWIKQLSIDEMINFLRKTDCQNICNNYENFNGKCDCTSGIKEWLLQEHKGINK